MAVQECREQMGSRSRVWVKVDEEGGWCFEMEWTRGMTGLPWDMPHPRMPVSGFWHLKHIFSFRELLLETRLDVLLFLDPLFPLLL